MPSRRVVDKLEAEVNTLSSLCSRLFPGHDLEALLALDEPQLRKLIGAAQEADTAQEHDLSTSSGDQLYEHSNGPALSHDGQVQFAVGSGHQHELPRGHTPAQSLSYHKTPDSVAESAASHSLIALDEAPELNPPEEGLPRKSKHIADDVNGLALSARPSSYVGISSISAAFKVIFRIAPRVQSHLAAAHIDTALPSRAASPVENDDQLLPPPDIALSLIESYFKHVHVLVPMIDEDQFKHAYLYEERRDAPWLALLNVVLALGSLASGTTQNQEHLNYYRRASILLCHKSFGCASLMVLQAHGLLSGLYMHWLSRPNEAHAIMGAAMRMATTIGLHREYGVSTAGRAEIPSDIRRRTWYSLVCLDTWACMTTGRPSFGRLGAGITVQPPELTQTTNNAQYMASLKLLPITYNIQFSALATQVQDSLAAKSLLPMEELLARDAELVAWHSSLPTILRSGERSCPDILKTPRALMHWWYYTVRIIMHRPYLISAALRLVQDSQLGQREQYAIEKCRALASEAIYHIDQTCEAQLMQGWNAVWLMYQAVMVPLISLFAFVAMQQREQKTVQLSPAAQEWYKLIMISISFFGRMSSFSPAATKSKNVLEQLLEASMNPNNYDSQSAERDLRASGTAASTMAGLAQGTREFHPQDEVYSASDNLDMMWDEMNWERMSDQLDIFPFTDVVDDAFGLADAF